MMGATGQLAVQPLLENIFREYGLPLAIRSDNGAPFASTGLGRFAGCRCGGYGWELGWNALSRGTPNRTDGMNGCTGR